MRREPTLKDDFERFPAEIPYLLFKSLIWSWIRLFRGETTITILLLLSRNGHAWNKRLLPLPVGWTTKQSCPSDKCTKVST